MTRGIAYAMRRAAVWVAAVWVGATATALAQDKFDLQWHGFVNPHYYADSRAVVGGREDMMLFYPKPIVLDSLGRDLNNGWQANMLAITARLGLRIVGPAMLGAKSSAYVEGDFTGATEATINNLRLRHAYIALDWGNHRLLAGQYWYPMVVHEIMPMTNPLNMGAPFHPYARQPQVRYTYNWHGIEAIGVAMWQLDNTSQGLVDGQVQRSTTFARRSLLPELNVQLRYRVGHVMVGAAANLKTIQPVVPHIEGTSRLHHSPTYSIYAKVDAGQVSIKAQTLLGNTLYEGCSLGGYVLRIADGDPYQYAARDWHFNTVWVDAERNCGHWRPGVFAGYAKNSGFGTVLSSGSVADYAIGRGFDIEQLWRIQPRLTYTTQKGLSFTAEAEYTQALYGRLANAPSARQYVHDGSQRVGNLRLSLSMVYAF